MTIAVFGSINLDITAYSRHLPRAGETVHGERYLIGLGGKGANQAAAAARLGNPTCMIGAVGADAFAQTALDALAGFGVDITRVSACAAEATGIAIIGVDEAGENVITVIGGANLSLTPMSATDAAGIIGKSRVLLLQNEVPPAANAAAATIAARSGATVIFDPAPAPQGLSADDLAHVHILTPNETEAEALTGIRPLDPQSAAAAAGRLHAMGAQSLIIKMGAGGLYLSCHDTSFHLPAFRVAAIDSVAAGDCFNAGLAHALARGEPLAQAARFAAACGALSTTRWGAAQSAPSLAEAESFLSRN